MPEWNPGKFTATYAIEMNTSTPERKLNLLTDTNEMSPQVKALRNMRIIIRAAQRHSAWIEKQCGISGAQLWVMKELAEAPGLRVGEIAQRLSIHQTTASNLVDSLCKRGLVNKQRAHPDQRIVTLELTKEGRAMMRKAPSPARGLLAEAIQRMDKEGLEQLNRGLQALINAVDYGDEDFGQQLFPFML